MVARRLSVVDDGHSFIICEVRDCRVELARTLVYARYGPVQMFKDTSHFADSDVIGPLFTVVLAATRRADL